MRFVPRIILTAALIVAVGHHVAFGQKATTKPSRANGAGRADRKPGESAAKTTDSADCGKTKTFGLEAVKPVGPPPKLVLQSDVFLDPVWRGDKLPCAFTVKNEGKGNLEIRLRGG